MTQERLNELIIGELIVAIGYALDAANPAKNIENRLDCMKKSEKILNDCVQMRINNHKEPNKIPISNGGVSENPGLRENETK